MNASHLSVEVPSEPPIRILSAVQDRVEGLVEEDDKSPVLRYFPGGDVVFLLKLVIWALASLIPTGSFRLPCTLPPNPSRISHPTSLRPARSCRCSSCRIRLSLLMILPLLFLNLSLIAILIFSIGLVLGHGGAALWYIILLVFLSLIRTIRRKTFKTESSITRDIIKSARTKLIIVAFLYIVYVTYTSLLFSLKWGVSGVIEVITNFIVGETNIKSTFSIQRPANSVLSVVPSIVITILGVSTIFEYKDLLVYSIAIFSLIGYFIAYVGSSISPSLALPRYVGLNSTILLTILSSKGIEVLTKRGRIGILYAFLLMVLAIASFGFSGVLMPGNPYTANPYAQWSISGLITYEEAKILDDIGSLICRNNYLLDWRTGAYLQYKYLWIQPRFRGFYYSGTQSTFTFAGSYGLYITSDHLSKYDGILVFRRTALSIIEAFSPDVELFLYNTIQCSTSILYDSTFVRIYRFT